MFLDRWIEESLLEDAEPCDEVDESCTTMPWCLLPC